MINWLLDIFSPAPKYRCHSCGRVMRWHAPIHVTFYELPSESNQEYYFCKKCGAEEVRSFVENYHKKLRV